VSAVKHSKWLTFILIRAAIVNKIFVVFVLVIKRKEIYKGENNKEINNLNYRTCYLITWRKRTKSTNRIIYTYRETIKQIKWPTYKHESNTIDIDKSRI
jgi:hypothetical protein